MSLLKYFQLSNLTLPQADGPLSQVIPSSSITAANKEVKHVLDPSNKPEEKWEHGEYEHFTPEDKAITRKRAAECGIIASVCYFSKEFPSRKSIKCLYLLSISLLTGSITFTENHWSSERALVDYCMVSNVRKEFIFVFFVSQEPFAKIKATKILLSMCEVNEPCFNPWRTNTEACQQVCL